MYQLIQVRPSLWQGILKLCRLKRQLHVKSNDFFLPDSMEDLQCFHDTFIKVYQNKTKKTWVLKTEVFA